VPGKENEKGAFFIRFSICVDAFVHPILDADMVSFGRSGFDTRKYGGKYGDRSCTWD